MGKSSHGVRVTRGLAANEASSKTRAGDMMLAAEPRLRVPSELQRMQAQANNSSPPDFLLGGHAAFLALLSRYLRRRSGPFVHHAGPDRVARVGRCRRLPRAKRSRRFIAFAGRTPPSRSAPSRALAEARAPAGADDDAAGPRSRSGNEH